MTSFVLIPGAWLGGWAWDAVAQHLRAAGHEVHPVTLTGIGDREAEGRPETNLDTHVEDVLALVDREGLDDVTLVGHSYGGLVAQMVADRIPDRLARIVYLDTGPLPDGWSMLDFAGPGRAEIERAVGERGDGWRLPFPGVDHLGTPAATAGLGPSERELMTRRATAQPFGTYRQGVRTTRPFGGEYERVVVVAGGFGMPIAALSAMIGPDGPFSKMAGSDWRAIELSTGHWPMLSDPATLATLLAEIADGTAALRPLNPAEG